MRTWRVARFADDPPIPNDDASPDIVAEVPCEDETDMLAYFSFYRDPTHGARRRNYHLDQTGRVVCDSDREATTEELDRVAGFARRMKERSGAPGGGATSVPDVDNDLFPDLYHCHGCPSCGREYLCANEPCEPGWSDLCPDCTARGVHP